MWLTKECRVRYVRFGGNNQYWTFLLELLSVIPEEVQTLCDNIMTKFSAYLP